VGTDIWRTGDGTKKGSQPSGDNGTGRTAQLCQVKKNACWIWVAVDRHQKRFVDAVLGSRGNKTGQKLWERIKHKAVGHVMTDYWKPYAQFIPRAWHIQSKAQTYTVESYNAVFRHYLARLRRKTKCYSKSAHMLTLSIFLLIAKFNKTILW
jgi:insertion element IS1 protein InsB